MGFEKDVVGTEISVPGDSIVVGGDIVPERECDEIRSIPPGFIHILQSD